jgi:FKBP-type peptidyl-prolyl cis-trans isomerase (trigger factor)
VPTEAPIEMQVTPLEEDGLRRAFRVSLPAGPILALRDARLAEIAAGVALPGFRRGEAPWSLLLQRFGAAVLGEVVEERIAAASRRLLETHGLRPAAEPTIGIETLPEAGDLVFRLAVEVLPEIPVPPLPVLRLERPREEPEPGEVAAALAALAERHGRLETVAPRPAQRGDVLVCDHVGHLPFDLLANGPGHGALAGTLGMPPSRWSVDTSPGLQRAIAATGDEAGLPWFEVRIHGVAAEPGFIRIFPATPSEIRAAAGETLTLHLRARCVAGALPAGAGVALGFNQRSASDFLAAKRSRVTLGEEELRATFTLDALPALAFARPVLEITLPAGAAAELTLRIGPARVFPGATEPEIPPFSGGVARDAEVEVGGDAVAPGFAAQLEGLAPGASRLVELVFPTTHPARELAGYRARFVVTAKALKRRRPHPLDDSLARRLGHANLAALEDAVRARLRDENRARARRRLKRAVLDALLAAATFPVPQALVEEEFGRIWRQVQTERQAGRHDPGDAAGREPRSRADCHAMAERRVRLRLLLPQLARAHGIEVSEAELAIALRREAARHPGQEAEVLAFFRHNAGAVEAVRAQLLEEKIVDLVLAAAEMAEGGVTEAP